jgi:hypothetical protein
MRPFEHCRRVPQGGYRIIQQLNPLFAAMRKSGSAQRDPKCARCSKNLHICEFGLCKIASTLALS